MIYHCLLLSFIFPWSYKSLLWVKDNCREGCLSILPSNVNFLAKFPVHCLLLWNAFSQWVMDNCWLGFPFILPSWFISWKLVKCGILTSHISVLWPSFLILKPFCGAVFFLRFFSTAFTDPLTRRFAYAIYLIMEYRLIARGIRSTFSATVFWYQTHQHLQWLIVCCFVRPFQWPSWRYVIRCDFFSFVHCKLLMVGLFRLLLTSYMCPIIY